jgi:hypothetical protein
MTERRIARQRRAPRHNPSPALDLLEVMPPAHVQRAVASIVEDAQAHRSWESKRGSVVVRAMASFASGMPVSASVVALAIAELVSNPAWKLFEDAESMAHYEWIDASQARAALKVLSDALAHNTRVRGSAR